MNCPTHAVLRSRMDRELGAPSRCEALQRSEETYGKQEAVQV